MVLQRATAVPEDMFGTAELSKLATTLLETLEQQGGWGISAPQLGESLRVRAAAAPTSVTTVGAGKPARRAPAALVVSPDSHLNMCVCVCVWLLWRGPLADS